jgi:hypothetical protein
VYFHARWTNWEDIKIHVCSPGYSVHFYFVFFIINIGSFFFSDSIEYFYPELSFFFFLYFRKLELYAKTKTNLI